LLHQVSGVPDPEVNGSYGVGTANRSFTAKLPDGQVRDLVATIWYPTAPAVNVGRDAAPAGSAHPMLIWSHGSGDVPTHASILLKHLASYGFVIAGVRHDDSNLVQSAARRPY